MKKESLLSQLLLQQTKPAEVQDLLLGLFTPKERSEFEKRIRIIQMLKAGVPQHDIADKLKVGVATVTRGSRELSLGHFAVIRPNSQAWRNYSSP